jgi:hypothetical protein
VLKNFSSTNFRKKFKTIIGLALIVIEYNSGAIKRMTPFCNKNIPRSQLLTPSFLWPIEGVTKLYIIIYLPNTLTETRFFWLVIEWQQVYLQPKLEGLKHST